MDANDIEQAFKDQLFEMTQLHKRFLILQEEHDKTRWYQIIIRRDLNRRKKRIVKRLRELVLQRDINYNEYLILMQTEDRFASICKEEGWSI